MKNIFTLLLFSLLTFVGVESVQAGIIVFNQDFEYIEQTPGGAAKKIGTMYAGGTYTFYLSASDTWQLESIPSGISISVNNGDYQADYAYGPKGFCSIDLKASPTATGGYGIVLTVIEEGVPYDYEIEVRPKPDMDGKFSCPTTDVIATPGFSNKYTDVVSLAITGNPIALTPGKVLGLAADGKIRVEYSGNPMAFTTGVHKIPVTVFVGSDVAPGTYEVQLDQILNIESGCAWIIKVSEPVCVFTLNCCNPLITPSNFSQNVEALSDVSIDYTLSGCTSYVFDAITNIHSEGVNGLVLNLNSQNIITPTGKITGRITGKPTSSGTATFNIPNFCSFSVQVKPGENIFDLICSDELLTVCRKTVCCSVVSVTELTGINYTLTSGTKYIPRWTSNVMNGLYAEVPAQTIKSPSGRIQVYIKGKPTKAGLVKIPVVIDGKTCYISVNVVTSGEIVLNCDKTPSLTAYCRKVLLCKYVCMNYSLSCGNQTIACWTSPKVDGVYAYVPKQTARETSSGTIKVYIKGCPTKTGTIKVPVNINGKTCYVNVIVK
ncbi:MAG: hypothetical protein E6767_12765 [Dysgonomonas sp.]|nr:hypothetical protein [Dysgonomonas sp.]